MYTVTFYSFKGGVGRTLALANVGIKLATTGRRVLLVDFDLEAPGIDTIEQLRPREPQNGLVEYVYQYMQTHKAPDSREYIYEAFGTAQKGGRLWIMPAGKEDIEYSKKLRFINWNKLYNEFDGFLMFEDLKEQWKEYFNPDYVLIDSRTGHTDIEGICTRQFPDAVVILFFPNEQNLSGLKSTVHSIQLEEKNRDNGNIQLYYVMSNVPDLDDEQEILSDLQKRFQSEIGYDKLNCIIHRYDSLSLLKQSLFIIEHPKSRLAKEYNFLLNEITQRNMQDRQAVIRNLIGTKSYVIEKSRIKEPQDKWINDILQYHSNDGEVLYLLSMNLKRRGSQEQSKIFLTRSIELGYKSPEAFLAQAEVKQRENNIEDSVNLVFKAFDSENLNQDEIISGIEILRQTKPEKLRDISKTPALRSLKSFLNTWMVDELMWSKEGLEGAVDLLQYYGKDKNLTFKEQDDIKHSLLLAYIGLGQFEDAINLFGTVRPVSENMNINDAFNYSMAEWGLKGKISKDMLQHVVNLDLKNKINQGINYNQCLSISLWAIGMKEESIIRLNTTIQQINERPISIFNCWRYMKSTPSTFQEDCQKIKRMIDGEDIKPVFLC